MNISLRIIEFVKILVDNTKIFRLDHKVNLMNWIAKQ